MRLSNRRRKEIASLGQRKYREGLGQLLVEGVRSVEAALDASAPLVDLVLAESVLAEPRVVVLRQAARARDIPVYVVADATHGKLATTATSQGVLAVARTEHAPVAALHACTAVLALDGVQDPGNVGTLVRTAAWFGAEAVLAGSGTAGFFNPKTVRAAMGGLWDLQLAKTDDLAAALSELRTHGFACYGADLEGVAAPMWAPRHPSVLVLGSEAHGLSAAVGRQLEARVAIPGAPRRAGTESLNVAVAAGILVYEWLGASGEGERGGSG